VKIADLKRPDLAHITCGLCADAFQEPEPPDWPVGALDDPPGEVALLERDQQARAYRLSAAAYVLHRAHAENAHTLDEHLEHAHANGIPLVCACGHTEEATRTGLEAMQEHGETHGGSQ
jgi:hypothetical protein